MSRTDAERTLWGASMLVVVGLVGLVGCGSGQADRLTAQRDCPDAAEVSAIIGISLHTAHDSSMSNGLRICNYFAEGHDELGDYVVRFELGARRDDGASDRR